MTYTPSPLRYPGGKSALAARLPTQNDWSSVSRVVEPFCGGASVSLQFVRQLGLPVHISDADGLLAQFWKGVTENTEQVVDAIAAEPITVARWEYWVETTPTSTVDNAVKALFLNRTSFSGILHGSGVIGGKSQNPKSKSNISARFNKTALISKIKTIGKWHEEGLITASHRNYKDALATANPGTDLLYLDPPYVEKAQRLYKHSFTEDDHRELAKDVHTLTDAGVQFILSYDNVPLVHELYNGHNYHIRTPEWAYGMGGCKTSREILISNTPG